MRYPEYLKDNGIIGFVAPSFGCAAEPYKTGFNMALDNFKSRGYNLELGSNCYESCGIGISNTPDKCARELEDMYVSDSNDVLISCGGGELMCQILEFLDFDRIRNSKPKWFMGYSDNTNFTFLLNTICDTASIYGSCAATYGMKEWHPALEDAFALLSGKRHKIEGYSMWEKESLKTENNPAPQYNLTEIKVLKCFAGNDISASFETLEFQGRIIGGCMDCLVTLLGTQFDNVDVFINKYKDDGIIWFLESCDLNVFGIRRAMWQMDKAGWFKNVNGFIIGRPLVFGQEIMGLDQYSAVTDIIAKYNVPIIMDVDLGHLPPTMPIISGSKAVITATANNWAVDYIFD